MKAGSFLFYERKNAGSKVVETDRSDKGWNGMTPKNKSSDTGTYYWIAKIKSNCSKEETIEKGFVQLVR